MPQFWGLLKIKDRLEKALCEKTDSYQAECGGKSSRRVHTMRLKKDENDDIIWYNKVSKFRR
jgi:hypothetical protein